MSSATTPEMPDISKFYHAVRVLEEFDCSEMRGVIKGTLSPNERETCFIGSYYRVALNVCSLRELDNPTHFQAISQLARTIFELAVDIRLIDLVPDAPAKVMAFSRWERLRAAREVVKFSETAQEEPNDLAICRAFIEQNASEILAENQKLWPDVKRLDHWSAMDLRQRVETLQPPYDETYKLNYRRLSWYTHPGLTGVLGFESEAFAAVAGWSLQIAAESYSDVLRAMIQMLQLDKAVDKIYKKLDLARVLAFTDNEAEANALRNELLG